MSALEDKSVELIEKLEALAPDVSDAALMVFRIDGAQNIAVGMLLLASSFLAYKMTIKVFKKSNESIQNGVDRGFFGVVFGITALAMAVIGLCNIIDIWNWIAIFEPKLALSHSVFKGGF